MKTSRKDQQLLHIVLGPKKCSTQASSASTLASSMSKFIRTPNVTASHNIQAFPALREDILVQLSLRTSFVSQAPKPVTIESRTSISTVILKLQPQCHFRSSAYRPSFTELRAVP